MICLASSFLNMMFEIITPIIKHLCTLIMATERNISLNGTSYSAGKHLPVNNRGFLYGDSFFETIFVQQGKIPLWDYHFDRLKAASDFMAYKWPTHWNKRYFLNEIIRCVKENKLNEARARLVFFRNDGGSYIPETDNCSYVIECKLPQESLFELNKPITIDIFDQFVKHQDAASFFKHANNLIYLMAGRFCKEKQLQQCLILNQEGHIAEGLSTNVFLFVEGKWFTPALTEACIDGVFRRFLIEKVFASSELVQSIVTENTLEMAEEVFLCNAVQGIIPVNRWRDKSFQTENTTQIHNKFIKTVLP